MILYHSAPGNLVALEDGYMSYDKVTHVKDHIVIGTKQAMKAIKNDQISEVVIASDADLRVTNKVIELAREKKIPVTTVESMKKLGKHCGIDVGAAAVGIKKS